MASVAIRDGQIRNLEPVRCQACGRLLFRIDSDALKPGKAIETKCKCDAMNYRIGRSS
jgi:phage FluMu protein Com